MSNLEAAVVQAYETLGALAGDDYLERTALSFLFQQHYLTTESGHSECVCGEWGEGEMEPGWDDHLADVAIDAGFTLPEGRLSGLVSAALTPKDTE